MVINSVIIVLYYSKTAIITSSWIKRCVSWIQGDPAVGCDCSLHNYNTHINTDIIFIESQVWSLKFNSYICIIKKEYRSYISLVIMNRYRTALQSMQLYVTYQIFHRRNTLSSNAARH